MILTVFMITITVSVIAIGLYFVRQDDKMREREKRENN